MANATKWARNHLRNAQLATNHLPDLSLAASDLELAGAGSNRRIYGSFPEVPLLSQGPADHNIRLKLAPTSKIESWDLGVRSNKLDEFEPKHRLS